MDMQCNWRLLLSMVRELKKKKKRKRMNHGVPINMITCLSDNNQIPKMHFQLQNYHSILTVNRQWLRCKNNLFWMRNKRFAIVRNKWVPQLETPCRPKSEVWSLKMKSIITYNMLFPSFFVVIHLEKSA